MVKDWEDANHTVRGSGQDGYQAEGWWHTRKRSVSVVWNGSLVLLSRWAALAQETTSEKGKTVTLQKQGRGDVQKQRYTHGWSSWLRIRRPGLMIISIRNPLECLLIILVAHQHKKTCCKLEDRELIFVFDTPKSQMYLPVRLLWAAVVVVWMVT